MSESEIAAITKRHKELKLQAVEVKEEQDLLWRRFDEMADETAGAGESYKYVHAEEEWFDHRIVANYTPTVNFNKLLESLPHEQMLACTHQERVPDMEKLEEAIAKGTISKELVQAATEQRPQSIRHLTDRASTKDLQGAKES